MGKRRKDKARPAGRGNYSFIYGGFDPEDSGLGTGEKE